MKSIVLYIDKFHKTVCKILVNIATVSLILMTASIILQVILRYFFKMPLRWVEEFAVYLMVWMSYLCLPYLVYADKNVVMELVYGKFKGTKIKYIFDIFYICFIVFIAVVYFPFSVSSFKTGLNIHANLLPITLGVVRIIMPISLFLTITVALEKLIIALMHLFNVEYVNLFLNDPFSQNQQEEINNKENKEFKQ